MKKLIMISLLLSGGLTVFSQESRPNSLINNAASVITQNYICLLHPGVIDDRPGKCFICGDELTLLKRTPSKRDVVALYTCPMHPDVTSNKPGTCTVCGMSLSIAKPAQLKSSR